MPELPLHPRLVHVPLALAFVLPLVGFGVWAAWRAGWLDRRTWALVVGLEIVLAGGALVAARSGEADQQPVERVVSPVLVQRHAERAEIFVWTAFGVAVLSGSVLLLRAEREARLVALAACIGSVVVAALAVSTGDAGGELVYRHGAARAHPAYTGP